MQYIKAIAEHLNELRTRLIRIIICFVISFIGGMVASKHTINWLVANGPAQKLELSAFSPWDSIQIYVNIAAVLAVLVSFPFLLWQIWLFLKPGLTKDEQKLTLKYIPFAIFLMFIGVIFAYFVVFQMAFYFTNQVSLDLEIKPIIGIAQYFSFLANIVLPVTLLFEMPVVTLFLTKLRILTPKRMKKIRRYAYFILVVIGVCVTPPDFISDFLLILPLLALYELSILLCKWADKENTIKTGLAHATKE